MLCVQKIPQSDSRESAEGWKKDDSEFVPFGIIQVNAGTSLLSAAIELL